VAGRDPVENAYSTSHWTVPAHASMLTGKYASEIGVHGKSPSLDCREKTIVEVLSDAGYTTRLWTANMQIYTWEGWGRWFREVFGPRELAPGMERSIDWGDFNRTTSNSGVLKYISAIHEAVRSDADTVASLQAGYRHFSKERADGGARDVRERVREAEFDNAGKFLLINLMETHTPHFPPDPFRTTDEEVDFRIGDAFAGTTDSADRNRMAYDSSAAYLSSIYEEIFEQLHAAFDYVITLSDHGELLGEHGIWNHGYGVYPELAHIPLVISGDEIIDESRTDVVSLLDIAQTLSDLTDCRFESRGTSLLSEHDDDQYLIEYHGFLAHA